MSTTPEQGVSPVEAARAELEAKRLELARLEEQNALAAASEEDRIILAAIEKERERVEAEINFQKQIQGARSAVVVDEQPAPASAFVAPPLDVPTTPGRTVPTNTNEASDTDADAGKGE